MRRQRFSIRSLSKRLHSGFDYSMQILYQATMLRVVAVTVFLLVVIAIINDSDFSLDNLFSFHMLVGVPFENAEAIAAITAVIIYLKDTPNRKRRQRNELAKLLASATPQVYDNLASVLKQHSAEGISLDYFDFSNARSLKRADLSKAKMQCVSFTGVDLTSSNFQQANLHKANFKDAILFGADLTQSILFDSNFHNTKLQEAKLIKANLCKANLSEANCYQADFTNSDLRGADLSETDLGEAILRKAGLGGAILIKADLTDAVLSGADLSRADLSGAILSGANLNCADLSKAILSEVDLSEVRFRKTKMPNGEVWNSVIRQYW